MDLSIISVVFGAIILTAVMYKYLQKEGVKNSLISSLLIVSGFSLLASPAWTTISWKTSDSELRLIRETTRQMGDYVRILNSYEHMKSTRNLDKTNMSSSHNFSALAEQLRQQKQRIENALIQDDVDKALAETEAGSRLIENIANLMTDKGATQ